jgi:hypothetical protein
MPPSGYTAPQSKSIINFLDSVSNSLKEEGVSFCLTPSEALQREINNIDVILDSEKFGESENKVLELTRSFYQRILNKRPLDYQNFDTIRDSLLEETDVQILKIHVPTIKVLSTTNEGK